MHDSVLASEKPDWLAIWHAKLRWDHQTAQRERWEFDGEHVVAYLICVKSEGMAIWKRLKVAEALLEFRWRKRLKECPCLAEVCETLLNAIRAQQKGRPGMLEANLRTPESDLEGSSILRMQQRPPSPFLAQAMGRGKHADVSQTRMQFATYRDPIP
ncbi:hypothetical protein Pla52n_50590 [Stieleria varia]|uniref:Uncharacterized protein n=1 Tax=Stieleria varia TaxID=2528005 RepID=A0A5C6AK13_9BACT|nr:hypothetical protein Pla52n_50590 [Stieleria varia]